MKTLKLAVLSIVVLFCGFLNNSNAQWVLDTNGMGIQIVVPLAANVNTIFAGTANPAKGVYLSTNNGTNWTQTSLNNQSVLSLAVNGNNVFAGTFGVYRSTNNGTSWTQAGLNGRYVYSLTVNGNNVFAGTENYGVYISTNNGTSWTQRNEGLGSSLTIFSLCIYNNYIFAGTGLGTLAGVYRRPIGELTGIKHISNETPNQFSLSQNYPNPFNPKTVISFQLAVNSFLFTENLRYHWQRSHVPCERTTNAGNLRSRLERIEFSERSVLLSHSDPFG